MKTDAKEHVIKYAIKNMRSTLLWLPGLLLVVAIGVLLMIWYESGTDNIDIIAVTYMFAALVTIVVFFAFIVPIFIRHSHRLQIFFFPRHELTGLAMSYKSMVDAYDQNFLQARREFLIPLLREKEENLRKKSFDSLDLSKRRLESLVDKIENEELKAQVIKDWTIYSNNHKENFVYKSSVLEELTTNFEISALEAQFNILTDEAIVKERELEESKIKEFKIFLQDLNNYLLPALKDRKTSLATNS